jgi:hypothetical protein
VKRRDFITLVAWKNPVLKKNPLLKGKGGVVPSPGKHEC